MKKILIIAIFVLFAFLRFSTSKVWAIDYFSNYDTHPDFWAAGDHQYTGKQYFRIPQTSNPGHDVYEVWSGPLNQGSRYVNYQVYYGTEIKSENFGPILEWEKWTSDPENHIAVNHSYAGPNENSNRKTYTSYYACLNNKTNTGHLWPNFDNGKTFSFYPESVLFGGTDCTTSWIDSNHPGGYIASHLVETWSNPFSTTRNAKCDSYIPQNITPNGNQICKSSPSVGIIYQRYLQGTRQFDSNYQHGCEATIYAWGYPYNSDDNYNKWFRNGELRFSDWNNLGAYSYAHAPDDHNWWDSGCSNAFTQVTNWVYSGNHQFDYNNYEDRGDPAPTSTPTNSPTPTFTPTSTPVPTQTPTPTPSFLPGDITQNHKVDIIDYNILLQNFGNTTCGNVADIDGNCMVDIFDYNILVGNFGK